MSTSRHVICKLCVAFAVAALGAAVALAAPAGTHALRVPAADADAVYGLGVRPQHDLDYGSFRWLVVDDAALARIEAAGVPLHRGRGRHDRPGPGLRLRSDPRRRARDPRRPARHRRSGGAPAAAAHRAGARRVGRPARRRRHPPPPVLPAQRLPGVERPGDHGRPRGAALRALAGPLPPRLQDQLEPRGPRRQHQQRRRDVLRRGLAGHGRRGAREVRSGRAAVLPVAAGQGLLRRHHRGRTPTTSTTSPGCLRCCGSVTRARSRSSTTRCRRRSWPATTPPACPSSATRPGSTPSASTARASSGRSPTPASTTSTPTSTPASSAATTTRAARRSPASPATTAAAATAPTSSGIVGGDATAGFADPQGFKYGFGIAPAYSFFAQNSVDNGGPWPPAGGWQEHSKWAVLGRRRRRQPVLDHRRGHGPRLPGLRADPRHHGPRRQLRHRRPWPSPTSRSSRPATRVRARRR